MEEPYSIVGGLLQNHTLQSNLRVVPLTDQYSDQEEVFYYFLVAAVLILVVCVTFFLSSSPPPPNNTYRSVLSPSHKLIIMEEE